jgi:hypothetical protein
MSHLDQARAAVTKITDAAETGKVPGVLAAGDRGSHLPRVEILRGELDAAADLHRILADAEDRRDLDTRGLTAPRSAAGDRSKLVGYRAPLAAIPVDRRLVAVGSRGLPVVGLASVLRGC